MKAPDAAGPIVVRTKFTAVEAARLALATDFSPPLLTPALRRRLSMAAMLWCRDLQFPTVRELGTAVGLTSTSSVTAVFGRLIDLQATVIHLEWCRIERLALQPADELPDRLVDHARKLVAADGWCLRLPSLVWSAVVTADPSHASGRVPLAVALHTMAAMASPASGESGQVALRTRLESHSFEPRRPARTIARHDLWIGA